MGFELSGSPEAQQHFIQMLGASLDDLVARVIDIERYARRTRGNGDRPHLSVPRTQGAEGKSPLPSWAPSAC